MVIVVPSVVRVVVTIPSDSKAFMYFAAVFLLHRHLFARLDIDLFTVPRLKTITLPPLIAFTSS